MIFGQFVTDEVSLAKIEDVREEVFGRRKIDLNGASEVRNLLVLDEEIPIGEMVIAFKNLRLTILEIGIVESARNKRYGDFCVRMAADLAISLHVMFVYAYVPEEAEDFFFSEYFEPVEGNLFRLDPESLRCSCSRNKFDPYKGMPCASLKLH